MALLTRRPVLLILLGLGLWTCGCAGGWPARPSRVESQPRLLEPTGGPPPAPAPALYIPPAPRSPIQPIDYETLEVPMPVAQATQRETEPAGQLLPSLSTSEVVPAAAVEVARDAPSTLRQLYRKAAEQIAPMDAYALRLIRREVVNGRQTPEEVIHFKFRREPFSVYLKWIGDEAKGREVVYVKGRYDNKIHSKLPPGNVLLALAGSRHALPLDSMLVKGSSRHSITQAGLENLVERFGLLVDALERNEPSAAVMRYLGTLKRPEFEATVEAVEHIIPPGADPLLPRGGQKRWYFDARNHLPVLIITHDHTGQEVEYYCHDRIEFPLRLTDDDFNPDRLWAKN